MNVRTIITALALAGCLAACADDTVFGPGVPLTYNANRWLVSDRPDLNQLQIVADTTVVGGLGSTSADRFDAGALPRPVFAAAVQGWFLTHGRHCVIADGSAVADRTYVFRYSCWLPNANLG
ncbi:MAG TPA: hypothetical protein VHW02_03360 [Rhizomicrobium sp.]|jgi:hypothetical protein|nr:hypothetical protein [Rhizomicrobium sp.]